MRKRVVSTTEPTTPEAAAQDAWLDLDALAEVEITSEDPAHPVESALIPGEGPGWRAAEPGEQSVRILFPEPQDIRLVAVEFVEEDVPRTQEYVLRWSDDDAVPPTREIVRQQWNFSPGGATSQAEEHTVDLHGVAVLELTIIPDISGGPARASLASLRLR